MFLHLPLSDKKAHIRLFAGAEEGRDTAHLHAVYKLFLVNTHNIHRHLARHNAHSVGFRAVDQLLPSFSESAAILHIRKTGGLLRILRYLTMT